MEEIQQSLAQARLRCLILEADKDAEIAAKNAESLRASKYRSILSEIMGEGDTRVDAVHHPQTSGLHIMPWNASAHSTSPAVCHIFVLETCGIELTQMLLSCQHTLQEID